MRFENNLDNEGSVSVSPPKADQTFTNRGQNTVELHLNLRVPEMLLSAVIPA